MVKCQLTGEDGNAFASMGRVKKALKQAGASTADISDYMTHAMSGDYDNLLCVSVTALDTWGVEYD